MKLPKALSLILCSVAFVCCSYAQEQLKTRVDSLLESLTMDQMLGQMTQLDIGTVLNDDKSLNKEKVREHARLYIGSYLNTPGFSMDDATSGLPVNGFSAIEWRNIIHDIQNIYVNETRAPPILYGLDSMHGANYVRGSVIVGHQLNAAASFNPELVQQVGRMTGQDTAAAGIPWMFAPVMDIAYNPLWSRTYETFGEDPYLASVMTKSMVQGLQTLSYSAACMKHFIGYSRTPTGHDRDGVTISDYDLLNYFAPPYLAAIEAGIFTGMEAYSSVNGVPMVSNSRLINKLLREDMKFDGLMTTDWAEIENLFKWHRVAATQVEAVRQTLTQTTLDMSMVPLNVDFINHVKSVLNSISPNQHLEDRIKDSARRILTTKFRLGLFDNPVPGEEFVDKVGSLESRDIALDVARESIVLVKNQDDILPIPFDAKVLLTGAAADNIGFLCGGWTLQWQGATGNVMFPNGYSILAGMKKAQSTQNESTLDFVENLSWETDGSISSNDFERVKSAAASSSYTILTIGEAPYAEKPGDIDNLDLPAGQVQLAEALAATDTKLILIIVGGRPRLLNGLAEKAHAVLYAMLPGEFGGLAIAEILYGKTNPSGKLPITYPKDSGNILIHYNRHVSTQCANGPCPVEWSFGHGLGYSSIEYSEFKLSKTAVMVGALNDGQSVDKSSITASVFIKNTGDRTAKETVLLFLTQKFRYDGIPEVKQLKKFEKVELKPGEMTLVEFELSFEDWSVYSPQIGQGFHRVVDHGAEFFASLKADTDCDPYNNEAQGKPLCASFTVLHG